MDAADLSIAGVPLPFKTGTHASESGSRRNKTLKQIINNERDEKLQKLGIDTRGKKRTGTPKKQRIDEPSSPPEDEAVEDTNPTRQVPTFEAPPSLMPRKKYCDITGLKGTYTDPKSRI
ncbi:chromatin-remodeling complex subunit ies6 [Malassezia cuniculi]|uniref:Chromatin-remodeling complex subunit ies6 n=1 Tax=Malassezia cuniculi TaxID=948313 RepID=A0AAF0F0Z6_9BASI|nr:chromatin-remodeling complex subunit ies6 [Malassezia cuniculi]